MINELKHNVEQIEMPKEMQARILKKCDLIMEEKQMRKDKTFLRKPMVAVASLALCVALTGVTALAASEKLQGYFKDITGWNGAVVGTAYEQATDEIEVSVLEVSDQLSIEVKFLEPEKSPYSSSEQMSIGSYKIVNAEGDTIVKDAASELAEVVDGKATIKLSLDQLPAGSYKLLISELISEKKADQPLTLSGNWKCEFVR